MSWLNTELNDHSLDFNMLQFYVLVVLYYEAVGKAWTSSVSLSRDQWLQKMILVNTTFVNGEGLVALEQTLHHCN